MENGFASEVERAQFIKYLNDQGIPATDVTEDGYAIIETEGVVRPYYDSRKQEIEFKFEAKVNKYELLGKIEQKIEQDAYDYAGYHFTKNDIEQLKKYSRLIGARQFLNPQSGVKEIGLLGMNPNTNKFRITYESKSLKFIPDNISGEPISKEVREAIAEGCLFQTNNGKVTYVDPRTQRLIIKEAKDVNAEERDIFEL